jgi:hypothetical protein
MVYSVDDVLFGHEMVTLAVDVATCVRVNVSLPVDTDDELTVQLANSTMVAAKKAIKRLFIIFIL